MAKHAPVWILCVGLLAIGSAFLLKAQAEPWHSDEAFYRELDALYGLWDGDNPDFDAMSREFHSLQNRYRTNKWLYADLGYQCLSLGMAIFMLALLAPSTHALLRSTHNRYLVVAWFCASYAPVAWRHQQATISDKGGRCTAIGG